MAATNLTGLNTLVHGKPFKHRLQPSTCSAVTVGCAAAAGPPHPADSAPYFPPSPPWSSTSPFIPAYWTSKPTALSPAHPSSPHSRASSLSHSFLQRPRSAVWPLPAAHPSASPSCPHTTSIWTHHSALSSLCQCGQGSCERRAMSDLYLRPRDLLRWALNKSLVSGTAFEARGSGGPGMVLTKTGFKLQPPSQQ